MTVPLQPGIHTRLCVVCYATNTLRDATGHTPTRGYAVCDTHATMTEAQIRATI